MSFESVVKEEIRIPVLIIPLKHVKFSMLISTLLACFLWAFTSHAQGVPEDVTLPVDAEVIFKTKYKNLPEQKALAIGPGGAWAVSLNFDRIREAKSDVVKRCQKALKRSRHPAIRNRKCFVYAANNRVVFKGLRPDFPLGSELKGEDLPLKKAYFDHSPKGGIKGIVLILHGCNRFGYITQPVQDWLDYFDEKGLRVIIPNSFADDRPEQLCGSATLERTSDIFEILRIRAAQTKRTVRVLKQRNPGLPILIWGHSEGSAVAQITRLDVDGVIASGDECGRGSTGELLVHPDVPLLVMIGSKDTAAITTPSELTFEKVKAYCDKVLYSELWDFTYLEGVGHFPEISHSPVKKAIGKFIDPILKGQ